MINTQLLELHKIDSDQIIGKQVLLRADLNVPIDGEEIVDDYRLQAIIPTIDLIHRAGASVVLATHLGRPDGKFDRTLSTKILIPWFSGYEYEIRFCPDITQPIQAKKTEELIFLENLRFYAGEESEKESDLFARQLANWGSCYVNDAFALLHRNDTSITKTPLLFQPHKRFLGPLTIKEISILNTLIQTPRRPFLLILGGGKIASKVPLIKTLAKRADQILLGPAIAIPFLAAMGLPHPTHDLHISEITLAKEIITQAKQSGIEIKLPIDYQIEKQNTKEILQICDADKLSENDICISIGPQTAQQWAEKINAAGTIFMNCAMGYLDQPETLHGVHAVLQAVANSPAFTVIGGGETVATARHFGLESAMDYLSTGGGATLAYLANQPLPGLQAYTF